MSATVREELKAREPRRARQAARGQRKAAIEMFCMECLGGVSAYAAARCEVRECFLWACAFGRGKPPGSEEVEA